MKETDKEVIQEVLAEFNKIDDLTADHFDELVAHFEKGGKGGYKAAYELLEWVLSDLSRVERTPALTWLYENIKQIIEDKPDDDRKPDDDCKTDDDGRPIVYSRPTKVSLILKFEKIGGRPHEKDPDKIMAIDILLRKFAKIEGKELSDKQAEELIEIYYAVDSRNLARYRKYYDSQFGDSSEPLLEKLTKRQLVAIADDYLEEEEIAKLLR